jgi:hypothetical protein
MSKNTKPKSKGFDIRIIVQKSVTKLNDRTASKQANIELLKIIDTLTSQSIPVFLV